VRVGQAAGRKDAVATRRAGFAAILLGAAFMTGMTIIVVLARSYIPLMFLGVEAADAAATVALAGTLLLVGASFFIADGTQTVAAGALRGLNDTRVPLLFAAFSFWGVAFSSGLWLAFRADLGAVGVWIGLSTGLLVYAALLAWRFERLTRRGYLPALPGA
jgi:multidrug resistance protein, MATE family